MKSQWSFILVLCATLLLAGCATYDRHGLEPARAREIEETLLCQPPALTRELEDRILALNPEQISEREIREVLAHAPAPRIINIHGGINPVHQRMISFSEFLIGMGYPGASITNAADGTYTFSCYESSRLIAGVIAWYYERDAMRAILVGHSQGGMQVVKVLDQLAGRRSSKIAVFNPLTWQREKRFTITDPRTGQTRPVVGLRLSYATSVGAGGLTRFLPNQWDMCGRLRTIPDSVDEFTGFQKGDDLLGGDFLGYCSANLYKSSGRAVVRNVRLPAQDKHGAVPDTKHLLRSQYIMDWINDYQPDHPSAVIGPFDADSTNILWAAEVWHQIKKYWVVELQSRIRAQRALRHDH